MDRVEIIYENEIVLDNIYRAMMNFRSSDKIYITIFANEFKDEFKEIMQMANVFLLVRDFTQVGTRVIIERVKG